MLLAVCDAQPNVRRRPLLFCRDLLNDPVACTVFSRPDCRITFLCPGPTDHPHYSRRVAQLRTHFLREVGVSFEYKASQGLGCPAESWNIITSCKPVPEPLVLGAPHQLRCAAFKPHLCRMGSTLFCCQCSRGGSAESSHETCRCPCNTLQDLVAPPKPHYGTTANNDTFKFSIRFNLVLQQASSKGVFRGTARLFRKADGPRSGHRALVALCIESAMMVNPLRPLRFWRPLRRPVLFLLLRHNRSGFAIAS